MFKFLWLTTKQLWIKKHRGHKNSRYYQNKANNNSFIPVIFSFYFEKTCLCFEFFLTELVKIEASDSFEWNANMEQDYIVALQKFSLTRLLILTLKFCAY